MDAGKQPDDRYQVGDLIADKYHLLARVGAGGMGSVWVAQNVALDSQVALKLVRGDAHSKESAHRLLREAQATARLGHPAIVRVFDFGLSRHADPFIVMELLSGASLDTVLQRRARISATRAVQIMLPVAEGLLAAHAKNVVHRDLKPENVFLHRNDAGKTIPKILDFGIAQFEEPRQDARLTDRGTVVGSPAYMSPEQARGASDIDHRTDIWSFGVLLYELVTGALPFDAENNNALLFKIAGDAVVPIMELGAGDEELWAIIERALRKDRGQRWQAIDELGRELAQWLIIKGVSDDITGASLHANWLRPMHRQGQLDIFGGSEPPPSLTEPPKSSRSQHPTGDMPVSSPLSRSAVVLSSDHAAGAPARFGWLRVSLGLVMLGCLAFAGMQVTHAWRASARTGDVRQSTVGAAWPAVRPSELNPNHGSEPPLPTSVSAPSAVVHPTSGPSAVVMPTREPALASKAPLAAAPTSNPAPKEKQSTLRRRARNPRSESAAVSASSNTSDLKLPY